MGEEDVGLFVTVEESKVRRVAYKIFAVSILVGIGMIWSYRVCNIPRTAEAGRWVWLGLFTAELWFGFYWIITQSVRWNIVHRYTTTFFKDTPSLSRNREKLPDVDIFVCTADPVMEPPQLVINTVLSLMAYDYPPEKLTVYLSDDGCSDLTFYALLEASHFSKHWIPFCNKFKVEPRSPEAFFTEMLKFNGHASGEEWFAIKVRFRSQCFMLRTGLCFKISKEHGNFKLLAATGWNCFNISAEIFRRLLNVQCSTFQRKHFES